MADNVPITAGTGTNVATDQLAGGEHVQFVKIMDGTADGSGKVAGDATNGLDVDVTRLPALAAGTNAIGKLAANSGVDIGDVDVTSITPGTAAGNLGKAEDVAAATGDTGVAVLAVRRDQPTISSGTDGDYSEVNVSSRGSQWTSEVAVPYGGYTPGQLISAATTNATSVKGSAGTIGYITASNINAAARYLKIYNKATAPTVGTDTPVHTFLIPGGGTVGAGTNVTLPAQGIALGTGIAFAITTGVAVADTGAVAANEIVINYGYN